MPFLLYEGNQMPINGIKMSMKLKYDVMQKNQNTFQHEVKMCGCQNWNTNCGFKMALNQFFSKI
jgi:hypothetical protein